MTTPECDVVIPVFNAARDFARLIESLLAARHRTKMTIFVVDDASSDEIRPLVPSDDSTRRFVYLKNKRNLGFAGSVNSVLRSSSRDVVLLNSDVLVFHDWIDRLLDVFDQDQKIGTITPLSNAATILSYPRRLEDNEACLDATWAELDAFCKDAASTPLDIPTGVGFCMAIRRSCLTEVGVLDAQTFGAGYGEENDFCRRAVARGWRNVAAPNVFVWHKGGASFRERRRGLCAEAQKILHRRYPDYHAAVGAFIAADPLRAVRARLDAIRIGRVEPRPVRLCLGRGPSRMRSTIELRRSAPLWRPEWRVARPGGTCFYNLPEVRATSARGDLQYLLSTCLVEELIVPRRRALPGRLLRAFVEAAEQSKLPIHSDALP